MRLVSITLLATTLPCIVLAAPRPVPIVKPRVVRTGPVLATDLHRVRTLHWGSGTWHIRFGTDGNYWCHRTGLDTDKGMTVWYGPYRIEDDFVIIEESSGWVRPDQPPAVGGGPWRRVLHLWFVDGAIVGDGWGRSLRLE